MKPEQTPPPPDRDALRLLSAVKTFGPVVALADGTIELRAGEIHALVGENGAGKSTLVKILAGVHAPDAGEFLVAGMPVVFRSVADSKAAGISVIYQEPTLFPDLSVAENIFIGRQPRGRLGLIDRGAMRAAAVALFASLGVPIDPDRPAEGLSIADQQIIEIAKAISLDARVLVMDEPTAALSGAEVDRLFVVARALRDKGAAILFISHRFDEVFDLTDRITVMRDGRYISTHETKQTDVATIVRAMVGRDVDTLFPKEPAPIGKPVLTVRGMTRAGVFSEIDLEVRAGEIVGLAGLVGAGRTEVARAIFGIDPYDEGSVVVDGSALPPRSPDAAIRAGIGFVPEDRRKQGLVMDLSVARNITLTLRRSLSRMGIIDVAAERRTAADWARRLQVKAGSPRIAVSTLSGGNQQKVVLAKWLANDPQLLIVDEPTRGIDVGTKSEVHRLLSDLAGRGIAILMISSELPEVLGMSDRVLVMCEGRISGRFDRTEATSENVMHAAMANQGGRA
ncbi:MAG: D-xylose ABC transporter ATP-binding protein [Microbacterium sp. 71-36]|uniref:sugar ABC transporter ATP-binding protein n=1 Tax=unclassified Microbacterium TaxID=2609290 RepID=UPI000868B651|nr:MULTISPECIES: sugar ABC transporter ATP-binding protein [unclassified Microbacterium]MBN9211836.1 sugar ABC transporter ATP-binding protein [Microbacterium sp.]ODT39115.1 MAG: D-xylose ABC transporter ATP-binding protein [Microbacterium sp. SCN 71-17]OJV78168.1 MAG: D-xylose ABC transporter ATP-binding protein [Microbacterium sp. 71-36]